MCIMRGHMWSHKLVSHIKYLLIQPCPLQAMCTYLRIISLIALWSWWWLYSIIFSPPLHCQWPKKQLSATLWHYLQMCRFSMRQKEALGLLYTALIAEQRTMIGKYTSGHSNSAAKKKFKANKSASFTQLLLLNRELRLESTLLCMVIQLRVYQHVWASIYHMIKESFKKLHALSTIGLPHFL